MTTPTQVRRPWRTTIRTAVQGLIAGALIFPAVVEAIPEQAAAPIAGALALGVLLATTITRIMAVPGVEDWLRKYVPALAADPDDEPAPPVLDAEHAQALDDLYAALDEGDPSRTAIDALLTQRDR